MWKMKSSRPYKRWQTMKKAANRTTWSPSKTNIERAKAQTLSLPIGSEIRPRRQPNLNEPLAFCADCQEWTPMQWLPVKERGKKAETWFQCEHCHGRNLSLRHLSANGAVATTGNRVQTGAQRLIIVV